MALALATAWPLAAWASPAGSGQAGGGQQSMMQQHRNMMRQRGMPGSGSPATARRSAWVKSIQSALNRKEHTHLAIDGIIGHQTRSALRKFQKTHGLKPTGHPNKPTVKALLGM